MCLSVTLNGAMPIFLPPLNGGIVITEPDALSSIGKGGITRHKLQMNGLALDCLHGDVHA